jgi:hypothetical protein
MSKLNLDIFGYETSPATVKRPTTDDEVESKNAPSPAKEEVTVPDIEKQARRKIQLVAPNSQSVKFVPVGFNMDSLLALDDAVLALRRQGHWKASKSGIIRALIRRHQSDLAAVYLGDGTREP